MSSGFAPLSSDLPTARRLARRAAEARAVAGFEAGPWVREVEAQLEAGSLPGRLFFADGTPIGFVSWSSESPLGLSVNLLYVEPGPFRTATYEEILDAVEREGGAVAFVRGPLPGLGEREEERILRARGHRPYSRSEMAREHGAPLPEARPGPGERIRPVASRDLDVLSDLHRLAYHDRFDRFLFLELADEGADARREVGDILSGRWGRFAPEGSRLCEQEGAAVGAVLSVRGPAGILVADVMVAPSHQGHGVGLRTLASALSALEAAGESSVYLNVTEGNMPALRLYRRLGFVRSLGPSRDWYNARRIPVAPTAGA